MNEHMGTSLSRPGLFRTSDKRNTFIKGTLNESSANRAERKSCMIRVYSVCSWKYD